MDHRLHAYLGIIVALGLVLAGCTPARGGRGGRTTDDDDTTSKPLIADPLNAQEDTSNRKELVHTEPLFVEESQKVSATVDESPFSSNVLAEEVKVVDDYQEETLDDLLADLDED